jgi:16S rRNA processing protein RimM
MGRITAPYGIRGGIRILPYTSTTDGLLAYRTWWLGADGEWRQHAVLSASVRARTVVATLEGCGNREEAILLKGRQVAVTRGELPRAAENEFYWADLIGLKVVNVEAEDFGRVVRILETGANDVLVVQNGRERLIPFIAEVIRGVDADAGVITVEWGADF